MKLEQALVEYGLKPTSLVDRLQAAQDQPLVNGRAPRVDTITATTDTATTTWAGGTITMGGNGQWYISDTEPERDRQQEFLRRIPWRRPPAPEPMRSPRERVAVERAERRRRLRERNQGRRSR